MSEVSNFDAQPKSQDRTWNLETKFQQTIVIDHFHASFNLFDGCDLGSLSLWDLVAEFPLTWELLYGFGFSFSWSSIKASKPRAWS